ACRMRFSLRTVVVAAGLVLCAPAAHAEDAETRTAARDLATQGAEAYDAGQYAQANDFFSRAYELVHAPSIALMRARSLAKLGQLLEAIDIYEQTARVKLAAGAPEAYVAAVDTARTEVESVRLRVPRLKLSLTHVQAGESPEVTIDDKPTPPALLGVDRPMNPGAHHVAVLVSRQIRSTRELELEEGKSYEVELDAASVSESGAAEQAPASTAPVAPSAPPNTNSSASSSMPATRVFGYAGLGLGAVGLGVGTYTGLVALHHKSQLDAACHPGCPESSSADLSGFRNNRTASWLGYGVGVAAAAAGVLLLTLGDPQHEHVAFGVYPGGVQIGGRL
ncbi:MAG TPA: hypothetical protein VNW92_24365, partial [Polyangiaceae bacterium]|nr:hypothetical protein [Polyangiaceae bacterium]